jgi:hypothetical protein
MDIAAFGGLVLEDVSGTEHRLGALWAVQPVVLVFLRHFG